MNRFSLRFASAFVRRSRTMADKRARRAAWWALPLAALVFFQGCARDIPSQQASAYSAATGFLTLCDDSDFDHALGHFAKPLKASTSTGTWVKEMTAHRGAYGIPVTRALVSRDSQNLPGPANEPAKINFVFRTSFLGTTPGDEYVSVEKLNGQWQVYAYKFRPSGKPGQLKKANIKMKKANIKKDSEKQSDYDQG